MIFYSANISKLLRFFILLVILCCAVNGYAGENAAGAPVRQPAAGGRPQFSIGREPLILELEDPLRIEQNQQIFSNDVFDALKLPRQDYRESPLRRGEIIFLIAYPYVYMYHLAIFELIFKSRFSYSRGMNKYQYIYIFLISAVISGFIAADDSRFVYGSPLDRLKRQRDIEQRFDFEFQLYRF